MASVRRTNLNKQQRSIDTKYDTLKEKGGKYN